METAFLSTLAFLVRTCFSLYLTLFAIRVLLQATHASFTNPITQVVIRFTNPLLLPIRRLFPRFRHWCLAGIVIILILVCIEHTLLEWLNPYPLIVSPFWFCIAVASQVAILFLNVYFFAIIIRTIASWIDYRHSDNHPFISILNDLTEPVLKPARRWIKPIANVDFSPIAVLILIEALVIFMSSLT